MQPGHGGNILKYAETAGCAPEDILDFSSSINPLGPPEFLRGAISRAAGSLIRYPDPASSKLVEAAARVFNIASERIVAGNGSNQLIFAIPPALKIKKALITVPSYMDYENSCRLAGMEIEYFQLDEADNFVANPEKLSAVLHREMLVFIGHPGNPAGTAMTPEAIRELAAKHSSATFVIDEAFADFGVADFTLLPDVPENVIVLRSLTKFFAIPGLRIGFCFASPALAGKIREYIPDWSVNAIAQETGIKLLLDTAEYSCRTIENINHLRERLSTQLAALAGLKVYAGMANYLLVRRSHGGKDFYERLLKEYHIAVRNCGNFRGLDENYFRIGLRSEAENDLLAEAIRNVLDVAVKPAGFYLKKTRRKPSLMLQGTCSNAGKSILTAAFCRILLQDGYDVAPFKAQNMALNSYVTLDGCEMGRAQAVQAEACRLSPDVRMNPVLLKPSSDTGSQVIVLGKPVANMEARKYYTAKTMLFDTVKSAYDSLEKDHEVIVLEGAGSPGEMNLKHADIVNMNMARYAESPVLLAGDIDRGGVYASFIGTVETFDPWERDLLKGFIVNKFRGDASLLTAAHDYVYNFTGKPVLGVVPYLKDLGLPEEDSVSFSFTRPCEKFAQTIDVALIALDHIANFTDFTPFEIEPDVNIRKVRKLNELGNPDLIILPGSKNVIGDMEVLRRCGLDAAIKEKIKGGVWLAGICGGLQLAGEIVEDPHGLESASKTTPGLGLLPLRTVLEKEKILKLTQAVLTANNRKVSGYEIHHGITECSTEQLISMRASTGEPVGFATGRIWLTYLHGVFDDDLFRREFIDMIRSDRGLPPLHKVYAEYSTENALNRLADTVRNSVQLREIYKIMGLD